eukprot:SAG11_NODE_3888_length_2165_cov_1.057599_3_plen_152_part_00
MTRAILGTCEEIVVGCDDPAASNYDPTANVNPGLSVCSVHDRMSLVAVCECIGVSNLLWSPVSARVTSMCFISIAPVPALLPHIRWPLYRVRGGSSLAHRHPAARLRSKPNHEVLLPYSLRRLKSGDGCALLGDRESNHIDVQDVPYNYSK